MLVLSKITKITNLTIWITFILLVSLPRLSAASEGKTDVNIKCSVEINDSQWAKTKAEQVRVKIENLATEAQSFFVIPSFVLEKIGSGTSEEAYWSPIGLQDGSARPKESKPDSLTLKQGESRTLDTDISKLNWGRSIAALWPFQNLFSVVPPGQYKFYFDLEIVDGRASKRVRSREVMVTIK